MSAIVDIIAREILDSRGNPTVEVDVCLKAALSAVRPCHQAHQQAQKKPWSCVTAIKAAI